MTAGKSSTIQPPPAFKWSLRIFVLSAALLVFGAGVGQLLLPVEYVHVFQTVGISLVLTFAVVTVLAFECSSWRS